MDVAKSCHNCRKRRLRCDRSVPNCRKCSTSGRECLGYGKLYRWTDSVASRGRMMGKKTFGSPAVSSWPDPRGPQGQGPPPWNEVDRVIVLTPVPSTPLVDPLFRDIDSPSRFYLDYFSKRVCQDLVVHDSFQSTGNPFRQLVAMAAVYPFLQHIIVAASALHYSNVMQYSYSAKPEGIKASLDAQVDALRARHKAIKSLQVVLNRYRLVGDTGTDSDEKDAMLAAILFFINFGLIDSGKGGCRAHMNAAKSFIAAQLSGAPAKAPKLFDNTLDSTQQIQKEVSSLLYSPEFRPSASLPSRQIGIRDYIASDSVAYYIWGSTLNYLSNLTLETTYTSDIDTDILVLLNRTEANSYHSCPAQLQLIILRTSRLTQEVWANGVGTPDSDQMACFVSLLRGAQTFDVNAWVAQVISTNSSLKKCDELEVRARTHIAITYQAAACLYVLLSAPGLQKYVNQTGLSDGSSGDISFVPTMGEIATIMVEQLSHIPSSNPLFRYTSWPVFMTGVVALTAEHRAWVLERMYTMWGYCPWGMMRSAMEVLREIWQLRDGIVMAVKDGEDSAAGESVLPTGDAGGDWLIQVRSMGADFLIV